MSNEHTPGPWRVNIGINQMSDMGTTIWHSGPTVSQPCGVYSDSETRGDSLADANLISAAPDLLEALESVIADQGSTVYQMFFTSALEDKVKAAIAKAKGLTN